MIVFQMMNLNFYTRLFIPSDVPEQDELSTIAETKNEINLISYDDIDWD